MADPLHVIVDFGPGIPQSVQGPALLALEKHLRELTGMWVEVFKRTMPDDSKLRTVVLQKRTA